MTVVDAGAIGGNLARELSAAGHDVQVTDVTGHLSPRSTAVTRRARPVTAFFGIRGTGSVFRLSHALGHAQVAAPVAEPRATVTVTLVEPVLRHGVLATPVARYPDRREARVS